MTLLQTQSAILSRERAQYPLGLLCFVYHELTILLLLLIIVIRTLISGVRAIIEAMRSKSKYVGLILLYGVLFGLFVLALLNFPALTLSFTLISILLFTYFPRIVQRGS